MKKLYHRFNSLNKIVKRLFLISLCFLIYYKTIFPVFFSFEKSIISLVEFIEKLFYAIIGSTIFYFINQHLPKEKKKVKVVLLLDLKIKILERDIVNFLGSLGIRNDMKSHLTIEEIKARFKAYPKKMGFPVNAIQNNRVFPTHILYFDFVFSKLKQNINDIVQYSEYFDEEVLEYLVKINIMMEYHFSDLSYTGANVDLEWYVNQIQSVGNNMYNLKIKFEKKYTIYLVECTGY